MREPLKSNLPRLLLEAIHHRDRTGKSLYNNKSSTIQGVIQSLVSVEEFKKKKTLELYENVFEGPFLEMTGVLQVKSCVIISYSEAHHILF